jgi:hypothetical protein
MVTGRRAAGACVRDLCSARRSGDRAAFLPPIQNLDLLLASIRKDSPGGQRLRPSSWKIWTRRLGPVGTILDPDGVKNELVDRADLRDL